MTYEVEFKKSAWKELRKLPDVASKRILSSVNKLKANPRVGAVRPMIGSTSWRLRVGDYRIVYDIHDEKLLILIIRVGHRRYIYKRK